jgi:hypothetical protein
MLVDWKSDQMPRNTSGFRVLITKIFGLIDGVLATKLAVGSYRPAMPPEDAKKCSGTRYKGTV